jgi:hypothetical protein
MSNFRVEIAAPATAAASAFSVVLTESDHAVQRVSVELKKDKGRVSFLTVDLADPGFKFFAKLPDIAFFDVPLKLYARSPGAGSSVPVLTFDGQVTAYHPHYGGLSTLQIVAHDKTIKPRKLAKIRTIKNKTSVQAAKDIAKEYGIDLEVGSLGDVALAQRAIDFGLAGSGEKFMSDWDHVVKALAADGLVVFVRGSKIVVQQASTDLYPLTFRPGDGVVQSLDMTINHVRGPGAGGNKSGPVAMDHKGTEKAATGANALEVAKESGGEGRTHRRPVGGPATKTNGAHTEDVDGTKWKNTVTAFHNRKDEATLVTSLLPDMNLGQLIPIDGFGAKFDRNWEPETIRHELVPAGFSTTTVTMHSPTSKGARNQVSGGAAFDSLQKK